jgi:type I restriction enzyme R subunit
MTPEKGKDVGDDWEQYIEQEKKKQLDAIIKDEDLDPQKTEAFMKRAFTDGYVTETGTGIAQILPPSDPFQPESGEKKQTVIERLKAYLNRFTGIIDGEFYSAPQTKVEYAEEIPLYHSIAADPLLPPDPD